MEWFLTHSITVYYDSHILGKTLTEEAICSILHEAKISEPDWIQIAKGLHFQLCGVASSSTFFTQWHTFALYSVPSWKNLASALEKMGVKKTFAGKIRDKTGSAKFML